MSARTDLLYKRLDHINCLEASNSKLDFNRKRRPNFTKIAPQQASQTNWTIFPSLFSMLYLILSSSPLIPPGK